MLKFKIRKKFIIALLLIFVAPILALYVLWQWDLKTGYSFKKYEEEQAKFFEKIKEKERKLPPARIPQAIPTIEFSANSITVSQDIYFVTNPKLKVTFHGIDKKYVTDIDETPRTGIVLGSDRISLQVERGSDNGCYQLQGKIYNQFLDDFIYYSIFTKKSKDNNYSYFVNFSDMAHHTQAECDQCVFGCKAPCLDSFFHYGQLDIRCNLKAATKANLEECLSLVKKMEIVFSDQN
jgi:hypothetical protein